MSVRYWRRGVQVVADQHRVAVVDDLVVVNRAGGVGPAAPVGEDP
jgi:hypothetical protein